MFRVSGRLKVFMRRRVLFFLYFQIYSQQLRDVLRCLQTGTMY